MSRYDNATLEQGVVGAPKDGQKRCDPPQKESIILGQFIELEAEIEMLDKSVSALSEELRDVCISVSEKCQPKKLDEPPAGAPLAHAVQTRRMAIAAIRGRLDDLRERLAL